MEAVLLGRLDATYRDHHISLRRFIRSKVSDGETAEDILQDVFERAVDSVNTSEPIENLVAWLFRAASNRVVDWYRRRFRTEVSIEAEEQTLEELVVSTDLALDDDMVREMVLDELYDAIEELPDSQREVILRQAIDGETFREISESTGVSINTLLARKRYAIAALKERLYDIKETIMDLIT